MLRLRDAANVEIPASMSNRLRSRRLAMFEGLVRPLAKPVTILDVGGTTEFWERRGWAGRTDVRITTINLKAEPQRWDNIEPRAGDARELGVPDRSFDVVFSNSVIEHLFTLDNQKRMASEVQRVGRAYWVQTPNYWFPVEPHFHIPGWQWLPLSARVAVIRRRRCGWRGPCPELEGARRLVSEVRLLTGTELRRLFPRATLWRERICGMTKSFVAYGGFDSAAVRENPEERACAGAA